MKEITKIKFAIFYLAKIISAIYLAYYLFSVVVSLVYGFNLSLIININLVALVLYYYFSKRADEEQNNYLKD